MAVFVFIITVVIVQIAVSYFIMQVISPSYVLKEFSSYIESASKRKLFGRILIGETDGFLTSCLHIINAHGKEGIGEIGHLDFTFEIIRLEYSLLDMYPVKVHLLFCNDSVQEMDSFDELREFFSVLRSGNDMKKLIKNMVSHV